MVDEKIADYRDLIRANANFLPDDERRTELLLLEVFKRPANITEAVKITIMLADARKERLTPTQIKDEAEKRGFNFSTYTNPLASIHTILRRMLKESNPPEVDYDEAAGTYGNVKFTAIWEMADPAFYKRTNDRILARMLELDKERITAVASEELSSAIVGATTKRQKK